MAERELERLRMEESGRREIKQRSCSDITPLIVWLYAIPVYPSSMALRSSLSRAAFRDCWSVMCLSDSVYGMFRSKKPMVEYGGWCLKGVVLGGGRRGDLGCFLNQAPLKVVEC